jgi:inosine/xanthosine triphosphatase
MKVIIGSKNPVKIAAVKRAFTTCFPNEDIQYVDQETASGVADQPLTLEETMQGAINRAKNASNNDASYSVGLEGGIFFQKVGGREEGIELSWACVLDCQTGRYQLASGPGFPVLPSILQHIHAGENLSDALEIEYKLVNAGAAKGYVGWLSDNIIDREDTCYEATCLALSAIVKEEKYEPR